MLAEVVVGSQLCTSLCDELIGQFDLFEAPYAVGCAVAPAYHHVAAVAMEANGVRVEDVVRQRRSIGAALDGEGG